ncbi:surface glycoprotein [Haladaptatus sp. W1]|uniref:surface glycoprotein n=1 Tax=Haladaptatus sp. W1 TaxID=1897478 RepID=UPI0009F18E41|nr:surface glycoprotein [Haladaptatus sp. W1]
MTGNNTKVRSLALTAMLVLSVFAGTMAFAGSAAAASSADATIGTDSPIFQGQTVNATGFNSSTDVTLEIKDGDGWTYEDEYTSDGSGNITFDTANLEGRYRLVEGSHEQKFQVVEQSLDMSASDDTVKNDGSDSSITFTLDHANRNDFDVYATSDAAFG